MVEVRREYEVQDIYDLVAAVGGASGVFLGISLLQFLLAATAQMCPARAHAQRGDNYAEAQLSRRKSGTIPEVVVRPTNLEMGRRREQ